MVEDPVYRAARKLLALRFNVTDDPAEELAETERLDIATREALDELDRALQEVSR